MHNAKEDLENSLQPHDLAIESYRAIMSVLERLGLSIQQRDAKTWVYSWHGENLKGTFKSVEEAVEAALKERLT